ncbi:AI-2E family transporter, partial [Fodinibius sp.]|uniref:AI-2E family transporter n=1 Tax=Fodinibius sp. TaxID=1872440 RepID=UPI0035692B4D
MESQDNSEDDSAYSFLKKVLIFVLIALAVTLLVMFVGRAIDTLLVIFAGVLLGTIFRAARDFIHQKLHFSQGISLALVLVIFLATVTSISYVLGPRIVDQADTFYRQIPETWEMTKEYISQFRWGRELARENPSVTDFFEDETEGTGEDYDMTKSILGYLSTLAAISAALVLVFVIAIYIAAEPTLYTQGFLRMFPKARRKRVVDIMNEIALTMQWWMVGQICSMLILGTLATLGLWLLGVPYALLLGAFTAFMTFIPNLGPIIAAVPVLL